MRLLLLTLAISLRVAYSYAQDSQLDQNWKILRNHPDATALAQVVTALNEQIQLKVVSSSEIETQLMFAAYVADNELNDYLLAGRTLQTAFDAGISTNDELVWRMANYFRKDLDNAKGLDYPSYSDRMDRVVRYYEIYLEKHPGHAAANLQLGAVFYNHFGVLQRNRMYQHDVNLQALKRSEKHLQKSLETDPTNEDAKDMLKAVRSMMGPYLKG